MHTTLNIIQIVISVALIVTILLQVKAAASVVFSDNQSLFSVPSAVLSDGFSWGLLF